MFGWIEDSINQIGSWFGADLRSKGDRNAEKLAKDQFALEKKYSDLNYKHELDKFEYDKNLQQTMFNREDNSIQRRVADLKASGLSPVLAAGQGAGAGSVVSTTAPSRDVPNNANMMAVQEAQNARRRASADMVMNSLMGFSQIEKTRAETARLKEDTDNAKTRLDIDLHNAGLNSTRFDSSVKPIIEGRSIGELNRDLSILEKNGKQLENNLKELSYSQESLQYLKEKYKIPHEIAELMLRNEITVSDYYKSLQIGIRYKDSASGTVQAGEALGNIFNSNFKTFDARLGNIINQQMSELNKMFTGAK